jgi:hypothetical protein
MAQQTDTDRPMTDNGREEELARYEQDLTGYLQTRIKPGLNRGSIPLLARSIAKEIARHEFGNGASDIATDEDDELDEEPGAEADDQTGDDEDDEDLDLVTALHDLQADLGEDWILYYSIQGDDTWLTAEKDDASQRVEAPNASVLSKAVKVLNQGGGRSTSGRRDSSKAPRED